MGRKGSSILAVSFALLGAGSLGIGIASAQGAGGPFLRYSDLESGPNQGGQNNRGAFVTLYGTGFGASRGSSFVTVGGGAADNTPIWSDTKISFQLGSATATGQIVVNVSGATSNGLPFTVRPGNVYFVSTTGNDAADGSFASPWRTLLRARDAMVAGDITYALNGVSQTTEDLSQGPGWRSSLIPYRSGTAASPVALIAYPGASVVVGETTLREFGIRAEGADYWVVAGLTVRGLHTAVHAREGWRIIGNDVSCPNGDEPTGCIDAALAGNIKLFGNDVHHSGRSPAAMKQYHAIYFTTDSNHNEAAWNHIHDNRTCHAIQFHSSPLMAGTGYNQYDLSVHDNLIHGDNCSGINFATVDPSRGKVEAYNNVIYDIGIGPSLPPDGASATTCVYVPGYTNNGANGVGNVEVFHNTCVNAGTSAAYTYGAFARESYSPGLKLRLRNNVVYQPGKPYISLDSDSANITGANNLWFGSGDGPAYWSDNINADPLFVDLTARNLRLLVGSPAMDVGLGLGIPRDFDSSLRNALPTWAPSRRGRVSPTSPARTRSTPSSTS